MVPVLPSAFRLLISLNSESLASFFMSIRQEIRCYGLIWLISGLIIYGPALATIGLALQYFTFSGGAEVISMTGEGDGAGVSVQ